jgi:hypothetical protein
LFKRAITFENKSKDIFSKQNGDFSPFSKYLLTFILAIDFKRGQRAEGGGQWAEKSK